MKKKVVTAMIDEELGFFGTHCISMVDRPAINENFVALSKGNRMKLGMVDSERRMLYGPVLIPDLHILRIDEKTSEEYYVTFPKDTIIRTCELFMQRGLQNKMSMQHAIEVDGSGVTEIWLKESNVDKSVHLGFDLPDWTLFVGAKVYDDAIWNEVKRGNIKGYSIEGFYNMVSLSICDQLDFSDQLLQFEKELKEAIK